MLPGMTDTPLLTVAALARRLSLPPSWLAEEAEAGRIPSLLIGRRRRYDLATVQRVLLDRAGKVPPARKAVRHGR